MYMYMYMYKIPNCKHVQPLKHESVDVTHTCTNTYVHT